MRTSILKKTLTFRLISSWIMVSFVCTAVIPPRALAQPLNLPLPGTMVLPTPAFSPVMIKGLKVHPENPLLFDFILDTGKSGLKVDGSDFKAESQKLIKYFLAALTIKEDDLWVNLSPYEKDRILPEELGKTELGRDMLAQDYILKQLTASLMYPEKELGKAFWTQIYAKAQEQFGTSDIPVDTFNKVWIMADKARVLERNNAAFVTGAHLKVMLESDYKAAQMAGAAQVQPSAASGTGATTPAQELSKQIIRAVIIPEIEKEVNEGQNFAPLRQMFSSMILATWYKVALKDALLNQVYTDKGKTGGVLSDDPAMKEKIYAQYLEAYKKGVFNYIREDMDAVSRQAVPRKYFSGGLGFEDLPGILDHAQTITSLDRASTAGNAFAGVTVEVSETRSDAGFNPNAYIPEPKIKFFNIRDGQRKEAVPANFLKRILEEPVVWGKLQKAEETAYLSKWQDSKATMTLEWALTHLEDLLNPDIGQSLKGNYRTDVIVDDQGNVSIEIGLKSNDDELTGMEDDVFDWISDILQELLRQSGVKAAEGRVMAGGKMLGIKFNLFNKPVPIDIAYPLLPEGNSLFTPLAARTPGIELDILTTTGAKHLRVFLLTRGNKLVLIQQRLDKDIEVVATLNETFRIPVDNKNALDITWNGAEVAIKNVSVLPPSLVSVASTLSIKRTPFWPADQTVILQGGIGVDPIDLDLAYLKSKKGLNVGEYHFYPTFPKIGSINYVKLSGSSLSKDLPSTDITVAFVDSPDMTGLKRTIEDMRKDSADRRLRTDALQKDMMEKKIITAVGKMTMSEAVLVVIKLLLAGKSGEISPAGMKQLREAFGEEEIETIIQDIEEYGQFTIKVKHDNQLTQNRVTKLLSIVEEKFQALREKEKRIKEPKELKEGLKEIEPFLRKIKETVIALRALGKGKGLSWTMQQDISYIKESQKKYRTMLQKVVVGTVALSDIRQKLGESDLLKNWQDNPAVDQWGSKLREELEKYLKYVQEELITADKASTGGIDLNAKNMSMDVTKDGKGIEMTFDPAMAAEFRKGNFTGLEGIILRIVPIRDPLLILGFETTPPDDKLAHG